MPDFSAVRKTMVEGQILPAGVLRPDLLARFLDVPREDFVPANARGHACVDSSLSLGGGGFLFPAALHARLIDAAAPSFSDVVLEIGAGTGYGAAILSPLVARVVALGSDPETLDQARARWETCGFTNLTGAIGLLSEGYVPGAPYTLVVVNGAVPDVPIGLVEQLAPGGRLVTVIREPGSEAGSAVLIRRGEEGALWSRRDLFDAFCPWCPGFSPGGVFLF